MNKILAPVLLLSLAASSLLAGGCGEKPVDPVKANAGQGQELDIPARPGRNERAALEAHEQQNGR